MCSSDLGTVIGGQAGRLIGGALGGYAMASSMAKQDFMDRAMQETQEAWQRKTGKEMTDAEIDGAYQELLPLANQFGRAEGFWEGLGNMANLATLKYLVKVPKNTLQNLFEGTMKRYGLGKKLGALAADTGEFTGRSPKDKFLVNDAQTANSAWWGAVNQPFEEAKFDALLNKVMKHMQGKDIFVRHAYACADPKNRLNIQVVTESAYQNLFAKHLFLRPSAEEIATQPTEWIIVASPSFRANPAEDGTRQHNFTMVSVSRKIILIGGSGYTGEIKKGIFSVLNYILPHEIGRAHV